MASKPCGGLHTRKIPMDLQPWGSFLSKVKTFGPRAMG